MVIFLSFMVMGVIILVFIFPSINIPYNLRVFGGILCIVYFAVLGVVILSFAKTAEFGLSPRNALKDLIKKNQKSKDGDTH